MPAQKQLIKFSVSMEDNMSKIEPTSFDKELIESFKLPHDLRILSPDFYFSLIEEKLEVVGSMAVGGDLILEKSKNETIESWTQSVAEVLLQNFIDNGVSMNSEVIIVGDNMLNYAYGLSASLFLEKAWIFFSIPQDTYVVANNNMFFQYTYEDELYMFKSVK
jgi:hypothetical protein